MGNEKMQQNEGKVKKLRIAFKKRFFGFTINISPGLKTLDWDKHFLIWRLRERGDHALISISTILKFSAENFRIVDIETHA